MNSGEGGKNGLGFTAPEPQFSDESANLHSRSGQEIEGVMRSWKKHFDVGDTQRMVAAAAYSISWFELVKLANRTDDGTARN